MKLLRTLSTARLIGLIVALAALGAGGAAIAVAAGSDGAIPAPKPLDQAIHDALTGTAPAGLSARISFTNNLFPSGALSGVASSALLTGATGRLWVTNDGRGRLELTSAAGDTQIVWTPDKAWAYDATTNTVYTATLPPSTSGDKSGAAGAVPALSDIQSFLTKLSQDAVVSGASPDNVGHRPAYTVSISPKHDGGLIGSAQLAFDAANGVPLRVAVYATGSTTPALALTATDATFGPVAPATVDLQPPPGAKVVDLGSAAGKDSGHATGKTSAATTVAAVQAALDFPLAAPDTLGGLQRQHVGLAGKDAAIVVYGQGLGSILVVEHKAGAAAAGALAGLPTVSVGGADAHELTTQLGTVLTWQSHGRDMVLAGSVTPAAAEAAARELQ